MSNKSDKSESPLDALQNETARQRWELFHRAIAYAKESNEAAQENSGAGAADAEAHGADVEPQGPVLSVVR